MPELTNSERVVNWPEFQAFMKRLGVVVHPRWNYFCIELERGNLPKIRQDHHGIDTQPASSTQPKEHSEQL